LLDLDFLAQAIVLGRAGQHPELVGLDAPTLFAAAAGHGWLPDPAARQLAEAYRLFDDVHHWQRLMVEGEPTEASPVALARLAAASGLPDARALTAQLATERGQVRANFERVLS
jgi:glutamate-ammonia-ligase adenylyltransferase